MGNKTSKKEKKDTPKEPEVKQQEVVSNAPSKSTQQPRVVIEGSSPKPSRQLDSGEKSKPKRIVENTELNAEEIIESIPPEILEKVKGKKVIHIAVLASATIQGTSKMQQFPKGGVSVEEALEWIVTENGVDSAVIFDDDSSITIKSGKYVEFEDPNEDDE
eukprot:TRINITY_DN2679_c0_g1_i4.p1 TRINITY_DN2679_c0_g1~~TRINITY_DN2679_c0_g1_i4.p1  ORF type:complete len:161 (+),score=49.46 TRINITY_DN2679_c0_g1_i4:62-544(+)